MINNIIRGVLSVNIEGYEVNIEYEVGEDDITDPEYTLLGGITETEIANHIRPNLSKSDFNEYVSDLISHIKTLCSLEAERQSIDSKLEGDNYGDYLYHKRKDEELDNVE